MSGQLGLAFVDGGRLWVLAKKEVIELKELPARMVLLLDERSAGMTGTQLAEELHVTPSAIAKAAGHLIELGIVRKDSLPVSRNVKLYSLTVKVLDDKSFKKMREEASPTLLGIFDKKFGGNEKLALIYVNERTEYLKPLS